MVDGLTLHWNQLIIQSDNNLFLLQIDVTGGFRYFSSFSLYFFYQKNCCWWFLLPFFVLTEVGGASFPIFYRVTLIGNHHHHHVVPLSHHFSLSFISSGRSSGLHPVSSHSCCMYVRAGLPAFARSYVGVYRTTSLMSSSLLLQQGPACLVRLTCIVFVMGGKWPYSWCLVGCCRQDLFNISLNILV